MQGERLLHCVKVFALEVPDALLNLGCVRDSRLEPGNMLGVQLPPDGVRLQGNQRALGRFGLLGCMAVGGIDHLTTTCSRVSRIIVRSLKHL